MIVPYVPEDLRLPCNVTVRSAETLKDVGLILADHVECLDTANGRITAIDEILKDAESRVVAR